MDADGPGEQERAAPQVQELNQRKKSHFFTAIIHTWMCSKQQHCCMKVNSISRLIWTAALVGEGQGELLATHLDLLTRQKTKQVVLQANRLSGNFFFLTIPTQSICSVLYYLNKTALTFLTQFINWENVLHIPANILSSKTIYIKFW